MKQITEWSKEEKQELLNLVRELVSEPIIDVAVCGSYAWKHQNFIRESSDLDVCVWIDETKPEGKNGFYQPVNRSRYERYSYQGIPIDLRKMYRDGYLKGFPIYENGTFVWWETPMFSLVLDQYILEGKDYLRLRNLWSKPS